MFRKAVAVFAFLFFFHLFYFEKFLISPGTLGFALFLSVAHLFLWLVFWTKDFWPKFLEGIFFSLASIVLAWLSIFRGDQNFVGGILWLGSLGFSVLSLYVYSARTPQIKSAMELFFSPLALVFSFIISLFSLGKSTSAIKDANKESLQKSASWFRGFIFALPVLLILMIILTSADPIFKNIFENTFRFSKDLSTIIQRGVVTIFWLLILVPMAGMVTENQLVAKFIKKDGGKFIDEAIVVVGSVVLLLGWFILVQIKYLFANVAETELHQFGVRTYSEYVTRGFGELLLATFLIYSIVGLSLYILGKTKRGWLKNLNLFLLAELFLLLISILRRLILYQQFHGLTVARVYGLIFLFWLGAMITILVMRHFWEKRFIIAEISVTLFVFFLVGVINVDEIIASKFPPLVNNEIDYVYLSGLSSDGYSGWISSYKWSENIYNNLKDKPEISVEENRQRSYAFGIANNLLVIYTRLENSRNQSWQTFNYSRWTTFNKMVKEIPYTNIKKLYDGLHSLSLVVSDETLNNTPVDRAPGRFLIR